VTLHEQALAVVEALRVIRADAEALAARLDAALEAATFVALSAADKPLDVSPEARLRVFRERGDAVIRIAAEHGVSLALLLGPGPPANPRIAAARKAAAAVLYASDTRVADIARILRLSPEGARQLVRSANTKKAAA
jgi:hypothetical protein